jgi:YidC/Oxa1 family membrane protein insertase
MAHMRKVQPKIMALRERYKDDRQQLNEKMMELYRTEKINPLGGCLPILVQIPVFIALYWVLLESVELRHAPFMLWIQDLSGADPYYVLPVLMGVSMFLQQRMTPMIGMEPMQRRIMLAMPLVFTVFFALFPAGLVLYWFVNNVLSISQQWFINRQLERKAAA